MWLFLKNHNGVIPEMIMSGATQKQILKKDDLRIKKTYRSLLTIETILAGQGGYPFTLAKTSAPELILPGILPHTLPGI